MWTPLIRSLWFIFLQVDRSGDSLWLALGEASAVAEEILSGGVELEHSSV